MRTRSHSLSNKVTVMFEFVCHTVLSNSLGERGGNKTPNEFHVLYVVKLLCTLSQVNQHKLDSLAPAHHRFCLDACSSRHRQQALAESSISVS